MTTPPSECPRQASDMAPQRCALTQCRYHTADIGARGPLSPKRRAVGDDCALNIANRGTHRIAYVALVTGLSRHSVKAAEVKAWAKVKALGLSFFFDDET